MDINQDAHLFMSAGQNRGHGASVDNFPIRRKFKPIKSSHIYKNRFFKNHILR